MLKEFSNFQEQKFYDPLNAQINLRYTQIIGSYLTENCGFTVQTPVFLCFTGQKRMFTGDDQNGHRNIIDAQNAEILSVFASFRKLLLASSYLSVHLSICHSAPTGRIYMKFDIDDFSKPSRENSRLIKI